MQTLRDDLLHAWRALRARRGFAATVILTLALAIGANAAIFSAVSAVLLGSLPYRDPAGLVSINERRADANPTPFSIPDFLDVRARNRTLVQMGAVFQWSANVTGGTAERLQGMRASAELFTMLGVTAARGRVFVPGDERSRVALLSDGLWRRRFGGDASAVGREIVLNGEGYTILGVLPASFVFPIRDADVVAPFDIASDPRRAARDSGFLRVIARLKSRASAEDARADLDAIIADIARQFPAETAGRVGADVTTWHDAIVGRTRTILALLQGAVVLVLLVACANLGNLTLAASLARERDFAVRAALGAARTRLVRQLFIESALLGAAGGAAGVLLASLAASLLQTFIPPELARAGARATIDARVLLFTLGATGFAVMAFGLAPAWQISRGRDALNASGRGIVAGPRTMRRVLVGVEIALAAALVILAGLLARSFDKLQSVDPGFRADHVLSVRLSLPRARYASRADLVGFYERLYPKLAALPGVERVAAANVVPLNNYRATANFWMASRPKPEPDRVPEAHYRTVSPDYFAAMQVPLLAGRAFSVDDTSRSEPIAIVNASLVRRFWDGRSPVGDYLALEDAIGPARRVRIVGVAGDVKHFGLDAETTPDVLVPLAQTPETVVQWVTNNMYWMVRTRVDPASLQEAVRRQIQSVDPDVPASSMRTMEEMLESAVAPRRFNLRLVALFACAALLLAATGVFSVTAHTVGERTREIGIRAALGAPRGHIVRLIVADAVPPMLIGLAAGAATARIVARASSGALFDVAPGDPATYSTAVLALALTGVLAAYWPARRARRVDPIVALRSE
jgi:putative ABC transport system permease protein